VDSRGQVRRLPLAVVIDDDGVRIFTRDGLDSTAKYRDLVETAKQLPVTNANIDGEIVVLNEDGLSDFYALRKAINRRQHDIYFVAFDLLHLDGHDLVIVDRIALNLQPCRRSATAVFAVATLRHHALEASLVDHVTDCLGIARHRLAELDVAVGLNGGVQDLAPVLEGQCQAAARAGRGLRLSS
jgi:hypothetical protein